jgi:hypothetical protein
MGSGVVDMEENDFRPVSGLLEVGCITYDSVQLSLNQFTIGYTSVSQGEPR